MAEEKNYTEKALEALRKKAKEELTEEEIAVLEKAAMKKAGQIGSKVLGKLKEEAERRK